MITDKNFRLSKQAKVLFTLTKGGRDMQTLVKHMMIDAQVTEEAAIKAALKSKEKNKDAE